MSNNHGRDTASALEPSTLEPSTPEAQRLRMLALPQIHSWVLAPTLMFAAVLIAGFTLKLLSGTVPAEIAVDQSLSHAHAALFTGIALLLGTAFGPLGGTVLLGVICLCLLILGKSPVNALAFGAIAAIGWLSAEVVKAIVARPRPDGALLADPLGSETGFDSFPSGHVSLAVGIAFALFYLAHKTRWQPVALTGGIGLVVALAWSRLYLGAHYPSDVIAAMVNASAFILFFTGLWNRYAPHLMARLEFLKRFGPIGTP